MNAPDVRRLLDDLGSAEVPSPDDEFLDRLEFQLRAEAIALAPDNYEDAPWRLPFGIAAAAFSVVVGVAGITVLRDLPNREVSAQLASMQGVEVILPGGETAELTDGMTIPHGAIVRVAPGGQFMLDGVRVDPDSAESVEYELTETGRLKLVDDETVEFADGGRSERGSSGESQVDIPPLTVNVPRSQGSPTTAGATGSDEVSTGAPDEADPGHDASRVPKSDQAERAGIGTDEPSPLTTPTSTPEPSTESNPVPTTAAPQPQPAPTEPKTTTTGATSTAPSTTAPSTTTTNPAGPSTSGAPPVSVPGAGANPGGNAVPPLTVPAPPGGTTTTTVPVRPDGQDGPGVDPPVTGNGGDGVPVDPSGGGSVTPAGGSESETFGDAAVSPAGGSEGETFGDGTAAESGGSTDETAAAGPTDDAASS